MRPHSLLAILLATSASSLAACSAISLTPDELYGTFQRFEGTDVRDEFTFLPDGTYKFDEYSGSENDDHDVGTFTADQDTIEVEVTSGTTVVPITMTYAIRGDRFSPGAAVKTSGDPDEVPGRYFAEQVVGSGSSAFGGTSTYELREDGTGTLDQFNAETGEISRYQGTWEFDTVEDEYEFRTMIEGINVTVSFDFLRGALGSFDWYRAP